MILEDTETIINVPDGYDARIFFITQLFSPGTLIVPVPNSNSLMTILNAAQRMGQASRLLSAHKDSLLEEDTTSKFL